MAKFYGRKKTYTKLGKKSRYARAARRIRKQKIMASRRGPLSAKSGFPKKLLMKHKYVDTISVTNTSGLNSNYQWRCNGMYDPNYSGGGHQPLYFDQMTAIYNHYTVIGSRIKVTLTPSAVYAVGANIALFINDDTTISVSTIQNAQEQHSGKFRIAAAGANQPINMYSKWSAKKTFGGSVLGNDLLQGTSSSDPAEQSIYTVLIYPLDGGQQTWYVNVEIEYLAVWDELRDIAQS